MVTTTSLIGIYIVVTNPLITYTTFKIFFSLSKKLCNIGLSFNTNKNKNRT